MKILISLLIFLLFSPWLLLELKASKKMDFGEKIWIHHTGEPANSIEGIENLLKNGLTGVEMDVFYIPETNRFVLGHDWPLPKQAPSLADVLNKFDSTDIKLWIDYKNARFSHMTAALKRLKELTERHKMGNRYFVESSFGFHQLIFSWAGINSSMWVRDFKKSRLGIFRRYLDRLFVAWGDFVSVSMPYEAYPTLGASYQNQNLLIFTVNEEKLKNDFIKEDNIKVVLTDL